MYESSSSFQMCAIALNVLYTIATQHPLSTLLHHRHSTSSIYPITPSPLDLLYLPYYTIATRPPLSTLLHHRHSISSIYHITQTSKCFPPVYQVVQIALVGPLLFSACLVALDVTCISQLCFHVFCGPRR